MKKRVETYFRKFFPKRIPHWQQIVAHLKNKSGLEIGGPSAAFDSHGFLPVYPQIQNLDGCNFSANTVWEGNIKEGNNYAYGKRWGYQYISDGSDLQIIQDHKYDFVLSCHSLEHIANPIKAVLEWKRILKEEGYLLLILPHKDQTFDHRRPVSTLEHLIEDYKNQTPETDETHFEEVISLHDISRDAGITDKQALIERTHKNFENRCVHQHVFNTRLAVDFLDYLKFKILFVEHFNPFHIVILAQKTQSEAPDNSVFQDKHHSIYQNPNFPSDRN